MTNLTTTLEQQLARQMVQIRNAQAARAMEEVVEKYGDLLPEHVKAAIFDWAQAAARLNSALAAE